MNEPQLRVLKMLAAGTITAVEANRLLAALGGKWVAPPARSVETVSTAMETAPRAAEVAPASIESETSARPPLAALADVAALAAASSEEVLRQVAREEAAEDSAPVSPAGSGDAVPAPEEPPGATDEATPSAAPEASAPPRPRRRWRWW